jgi:NifB/MoaA-like Fe-S oxidoreductase
MEYQPDLKNITGVGGVIASIESGGIAEELGLQPGDTVVAINDRQLRDVIDYRFLIADERVELLVRRGDEDTVYEIEKDPDDDLGIDFTEPLFDRVRTCNNKCPFCFLTQMPRGLRKSLYLKDDDYRLGFLYGNFVTLTNLTEADWQRIEEQHLSPMYISTHATDRELRAVLLGKPDVPDMIEQIQRFGRMGIECHTQIVAVPELNDGAALHQSIRELAAHYPTIQTIAVVPVGLTKFRFNGKAPQSIKSAIHVHETPEWIDTNWERQPLWDQGVSSRLSVVSSASRQTTDNRQPTNPANDFGFCGRQLISTDIPLRCYRPDEAARVIDLIEPYQERCRKEYGVSLVYPSDEFYILCGRELPPAATYDGMPQYSNGVGMTRDFIDCWTKAQRRLPSRLARPTELTLVCGMLIVPILQQLINRLNQVEGLHARLLPVQNQFFGETVTVSGLLTGQDVVAALRDSDAQRALLPRVMFDHTATRTLDEYSPERIAAESGVPVAVIGEPEEIVRYVRALKLSGEG